MEQFGSHRTSREATMNALGEVHEKRPETHVRFSGRSRWVVRLSGLIRVGPRMPVVSIRRERFVARYSSSSPTSSPLTARFSRAPGLNAGLLRASIFIGWRVWG